MIGVFSAQLSLEPKVKSYLKKKKKKRVPGTRYHHPVENPKNWVELSQVKLSWVANSVLGEKGFKI